MKVTCFSAPVFKSTEESSGAIDMEKSSETIMPAFRLIGPRSCTPSVTFKTPPPWREILKIWQVPRWEQVKYIVFSSIHLAPAASKSHPFDIHVLEPSFIL